MVSANRFTPLENLDMDDVFLLATAAESWPPLPRPRWVKKPLAPAKPPQPATGGNGRGSGSGDGEASAAKAPRPATGGGGRGSGFSDGESFFDSESYFPVNGSNRSFTVAEDGEVLDPNDEWLWNSDLPRPKPNTYRGGRGYGFPRRGCLSKEDRIALQRQFDRHSGILVKKSPGYERRKWMLMREFWQITSPKPETTNSMGDFDLTAEKCLELLKEVEEPALDEEGPEEKFLFEQQMTLDEHEKQLERKKKALQVICDEMNIGPVSIAEDDLMLPFDYVTVPGGSYD